MTQQSPSSTSKRERIAQAAQIGPLHEAAMRREVGGSGAQSHTKASTAKVEALTITGMLNPKHMTLDLEKWFPKLEVDDRYQRQPVPSVVNGLERALRAGGLSLAPIVLAKRTWQDEHTKPGMLYIVDGQQRVLAHVAAEREVEAVIYESVNLQAERQAFTILNMTPQKVDANKLAMAFSGPAFELLRQVCAEPGHPLHRRIKWASGGGTTPLQSIDATAALKGLASLLVPVSSAGSAGVGARAVKAIFPALNAYYSKQKAEAFYRLLGQAVGDHCPVLYAIGLGVVAREMWQTKLDMPSGRALDAMRRTNWRAVCLQKNSILILPLVTEQIKKKWR